MKKRSGLIVALIGLGLGIAIVLFAVIIVLSLPKDEVGRSPVVPTPSLSPTLSKLDFDNVLTPEASPTIVPVSKKYPLDRSFILPIRDPKGEVVGEVKYLIKEYEFTNKVVVNRIYDALLKENKELLALHVELTNDTNLAFKIPAGDYVRLTGNDNKLIAPDFPKEPLDVRPKSTAETSIGFIIDKNSENLEIRLGEQDKETEKISLTRGE